MTSPLFLFRPNVREERVVCSAGSISVSNGTEKRRLAIAERIPGSSRRRARKVRDFDGFGR